MSYKDIPIGIDLGTTNSVIGAFRNGVVEILPNQINRRTTPSIVSFCGNKISIGEQTQNKLFNDPEKVIYSIKRIIGKKFSDKNFNLLIKDLAYKNKISKSESNRPLINVDFNGKNEYYYPEEISAMILKRLKENAEDYLGQKIKKAVITIPAYFTEAQRYSTKLAGEAAGLEIIKIINEPTAAALAFGIGEKKDIERADDDDDNEFFLLDENKSYIQNENKHKKNILVFDLGGGTLDVTCLKITKDEYGTDFSVLGHSGNTVIGGDDFDNHLLDYCIQKFQKDNKNSIFINTTSKEALKARKRLKIQCEQAKKNLSYQRETTIRIDSLFNGIDFEIKITRDEFEVLCKDLFEKLINPIKKALNVAKLNKSDIDEILFVGGSTRIPKIEEKIKEFFGKNKKVEKKYNPDELVAYGATLQAAISMNKTAVDDVIINDICSHSLGIMVKGEIFKDEFSQIIKNGQNIPFDAEKQFTTAHDYQESALIQIFEGENILCRNNRLLGSFSIENITRAKKGIPQIKVKIEIDQDGIINVAAKEEASGVNGALTIKGDKGVMNEEEKKRMKDRLNRKEDFEKSIK